MKTATAVCYTLGVFIAFTMTCFSKADTLLEVAITAAAATGMHRSEVSVSIRLVHRAIFQRLTVQSALSTLQRDIPHVQCALCLCFQSANNSCSLHFSLFGNGKLHLQRYHSKEEAKFIELKNKKKDEKMATDHNWFLYALVQ